MKFFIKKIPLIKNEFHSVCPQMETWPIYGMQKKKTKSVPEPSSPPAEWHAESR
jgi:hypothetical protein